MPRVPVRTHEAHGFLILRVQVRIHAVPGLFTLGIPVRNHAGEGLCTLKIPVTNSFSARFVHTTNTNLFFLNHEVQGLLE